MPVLPAIAPATPSAAALADDQLAVLRSLLAGASPPQRLFISGYVAGFQAALDPPTAAATQQPATVAAALPPAARAPLTILYATESGNAEALAGSARKAAARLGFAARLLDMADAEPATLAAGLGADGRLLVIASTWGEGDPPQRAEAFYAALMDQAAPRLDGVRFAVLALGDRAYANFCATGQRLDARLAALGASRAAPIVECDLDYATPAQSWTAAILRTLADEAAAPPQSPPTPSATPSPTPSPTPLPAAIHDASAVIHVDFARVQGTEPDAADDASLAGTASLPAASPIHPAEIAALVNLNGSRSSVETIHAELSLAGTGLAYQPGDAIGIAPRNDPALVEAVLRQAGLADDAALAARLDGTLDITTLTVPQVAAYGALTGDAALLQRAADPAACRAFIADRQFIDLLRAAPMRLDAATLSGLLRPLPPRLYSVASSQALVGQEAHLLVGRVRWESHGMTRHGVASGMLAAHRRVGQTLDVFVKPNPHFRLPGEPERPIVMIGPGTGVAPFRAFLQEREATGATGRTWLFFGARRFTHDFLYQLDWQDWLKSGVLTRLDVAFSRDQPERIHVQQRMWERRRELRAWIADGAAIYVCGDAAAMAKDVHAMLLRILAETDAGPDDEAARRTLRAMQQERRYLRDVY